MQGLIQRYLDHMERQQDTSAAALAAADSAAAAAEDSTAAGADEQGRGALEEEPAPLPAAELQEALLAGLSQRARRRQLRAWAAQGRALSLTLQRELEAAEAAAAAAAAGGVGGGDSAAAEGAGSDDEGCCSSKNAATQAGHTWHGQQVGRVPCCDPCCRAATVVGYDGKMTC